MGDRLNNIVTSRLRSNMAQYLFKYRHQNDSAAIEEWRKNYLLAKYGAQLLGLLTKHAAKNKYLSIADAFYKWKSPDNQTSKEDKLKMLVFIYEKFTFLLKHRAVERWKILETRQHIIRQCQAIAKMIKLDKIVENAMKRRVIDCWKPPRLNNIHFKRAAAMIAKNSRINTQIAYWRLRDAALSNGGGHLDIVKINKCKKLFTHLRKCFDRTLNRAFISIEN